MSNVKDLYSNSQFEFSCTIIELSVWYESRERATEDDLKILALELECELVNLVVLFDFLLKFSDPNMFSICLK